MRLIDTVKSIIGMDQSSHDKRNPEFIPESQKKNMNANSGKYGVFHG